MTEFTRSFAIDDSLRIFLSALEEYFSIRIYPEIIEKVFTDAEEDQVSEKRYILFEGKTRLFHSALIIHGNVDEYEPETIYITIKNTNKETFRHLERLVEG